jgi:hypothetical protein
MKKVIWLCVTMALLGVIPNLAAQTGATQAPQGRHALDLFDDMGDFDAVPTLSTESRYSAGVFGSYVDDFISVNDYDPAIGTFLFLGGFPVRDGGNVDTTAVLTDAILNGYTLSAGFAKSFSKFYLGVYFGGNIVNASGTDDQGDQVAKVRSSATATWNTRLAVLFGTDRIGGLRLDLILNDFDGTTMNPITDTTTNDDGKVVSPGNGTGISLALSWGRAFSFREKDLPVHAKLGYRFPDYTLNYAGTGDKQETYTNAAWLINGGVSYDLNDISTVEADLYVGGTFGEWGVGDLTNRTVQGDFGVKLEAALANSISPVAGLEIGFSPNLGIGVYGQDPNVVGDNSADTYATTSFEIALGLDAGIKARLPGKFNKFTMITGAGINIFDWWVTGVTGGAPSGQKMAKGNSAWEIEGVSWNTDTLGPNNGLGIGTVFAPNDNLSVGFGISALLENLLEVDLVHMQVRPGDFFTSEQPGINGGNNGPFGGLFGGANPIQFDLTVSYRF